MPVFFLILKTLVYISAFIFQIITISAQCALYTHLIRAETKKTYNSGVKNNIGGRVKSLLRGAPTSFLRVCIYWKWLIMRLVRLWQTPIS